MKLPALKLRPMITIVHYTRSCTAIMTTAALLLTSTAASADWRFPHGDAANTGFARVNTNAAQRPKVALTGPVAPGANPVTGPDGTVYVGNLDGELRAYHADGSPSWTRKLTSEQGLIFAAPVVGADGSVYVVSSIHRKNPDGFFKASFLHKFTPGGGLVFSRPFPQSNIFPFTDGGVTTAAPNIWSWAGYEAIIVPVIYTGQGRENLSLVAFSTYGAVLGQQDVTTKLYDITVDTPFSWGGLAACLAAGITSFEIGCFVIAWGSGWLCCSFGAPPDGPLPLIEAGTPLPGVAIYQDPRGGTLRVLVTDGKQDKVLYAFAMQYGFTELVRVSSDRRSYATPPVALPDGTAVLGSQGGVVTQFGPTLADFTSVSGLGVLTAPPTRMKDGNLIIVSREGKVSKPGGPSWQPGGESIAAAASCTHVFVSTTEGLFTYDTKTLVQKAFVPWTNGGRSAPIIGPSGNVYAIASDILYAFPPPLSGGVVGTSACDEFGKVLQ